MATFDLSRTFVHLGLGATATPIPDFSWTSSFMDAYAQSVAGDGDEGRLVCIVAQDATWDTWERHPAGEEVVFLISGRVDIVLDLDDGQRIIELHAGEAMVNPTNVWHTARVHQPGRALFITPGCGTEHRPLA
jgi:mannose-6-phosphate isomerase-like protein (cupin superfamily)